MGSCYSCKSGGGAPLYTTVKMDSKKKAEENSSVKQITPYSRSSSNSFGFKRRLPSTLKSLSQERTSELVQNYESKIATINNSSNQSVLKAENNFTNKLNATNRNLHSNIPRFSSKNSTAGSSIVETLVSTNSIINALDPNCNTLIEGMSQNMSNSLTVENKKMGAKSQPENNKALRRIIPRESENMSEKIQSVNKVESKETAAAKGRLGKAGLSPKQEKSSLRTASKGLSQVSGLPKPTQKKGTLINKDNTKNETLISSFTTNRAPLAKFEDIEAMHVSTDTLTEEENLAVDVDSGIGTSISEKNKKQDGDSETLAEISELAKDNYNVSHTREELPDKILPTFCQNGCSKTKKMGLQKSASSTSYKLDKTQTNLNISRPQGLPVPSKHIPCLQTRVGSPTEEKKKHLKMKDEEQQKKSGQKQCLTKISSPESKEKHINKVKYDRTSSTSTDVVIINGEIQMKCSYNKEITSPKSTSNTKMDEVMKTSSSRSEEMTTSVESSTSQQDSFQDGGLCSPPSERETFLIDDEIADQPELIACQPQELHGIFHSTQDSFCLDHEQFLGDDGNAGQDLYRGGSMETSSTSSISSEDLMLDYETLEESVLGNISKNLPNWSRAHHSRSCSASEAHANSSAESHRLLGSPKPMTAFEAENGGLKSDSTPYHILVQDVDVLRTSLLKLERILKESETLNPFDNSHSWKNGLLHNLALSDPPNGCCSDNSVSESNSEIKMKEITQENVDLRRQVVFLEQELAEKIKTIKLLQQQMVKYVPEALVSSEKDVCNAATQTEKTRLSLTSLSQSYEDSVGATTVSTNGHLMEGILDHPVKGKKRLMQTSLNATQSLNSLSSRTHAPGEVCHLERGTYPPERSASAVELCPHGTSNSSQATTVTSVVHKHSKSLDGGTGGSVLKKKSIETSSQLSRSKIAVRLSNKGTLPQQPKMGTGVKYSKTATNRPSSKNSTIKK